MGPMSDRKCSSAALVNDSPDIESNEEKGPKDGGNRKNSQDKNFLPGKH